MNAELDTRIRVETPEGIALGLRTAGLVPRCLAYLLDGLIRLVVFMLASLVLAPLGGTGSALLLVLAFLLEWFYPVLFEQLPGAATPGKRVLGLRVVMDNGLPVTPAASMLRNLLRAADFLPMLYGAAIVSMLLRTDFKRIGDLAAGTLVVHAEAPAAAAAWPDVDGRAPARPLSRQEQAAVVEWAARARRLTPERADELAALAQPVLGPVSPAVPARDELQRVAAWLLGRREGPQT